MFSIFGIARLFDVPVLTVPIFDKMQERRGAKFINFGNKVFRRATSGAIRPDQFCVESREAAKGDNAKNVFMKVTRYHTQTTL